jgi:alpha-mannosidase
MTRFAEAEQIGRGLTEGVLRAIGRHVPEGAFAAVNPSPTERTDLVELDLPLDRSPVGSPVVLPDGALAPTQDLGVVERTIDDVLLPAGEIVPYLRRRMHARELYAHQVNGYRLSPGAAETVVTLDVDRAPDPPSLDVDALLEALDVQAARTPSATWRLLVVARPRRRLLALVPVPALGWTAVRPAEPGVMVAQADRVSIQGRILSNGLVAVVVADDGTLTIEGGGVTLTGAGRLVDGGDVGDSYNYAPPASDALIEQPHRVDVRAGETGPLRADFVVTRTYEWPVGLREDLSSRLAKTVRTGARMVVQLRVGEPFVRLSIEFDNRAVDHRLRFHVPLLRSAVRTFAEGQFAVVERGTVMEGGHGERPLPTFPAHGLVSADGAAILLDHVLEYELVDGPELVLTLLRATGLISRDQHPYRDEPAGPVIAAPTGQGRGIRRVSFALLPVAEGRPSAAVLATLERYRNPFLVAGGEADSGLALHSRQGLAVEGDGVVLSSLRRRGTSLEIRLVNELGREVAATVRGPFRTVQAVDLLGRVLEEARPAAGRAEVMLGPWEIATFSLDDGPRMDPTVWSEPAT